MQESSGFWSGINQVIWNVKHAEGGEVEKNSKMKISVKDGEVVSIVFLNITKAALNLRLKPDTKAEVCNPSPSLSILKFYFEHSHGEQSNDFITFHFIEMNGTVVFSYYEGEACATPFHIGTGGGGRD